ncbi:MAG: ubiquinol-cytochrome c reductase iron-sulfur subunit [Pseudomonadota bacterium]|nr:ubiquinol-cytochrome c reductase iron-sulfur subunit [Pseudomonadota bacterium]
MSHQPPLPLSSAPHPTATTRRDFMMLTAAGLTGIGVGAAAWPFINSMNPAADVLALSSIEVDLSPIQVGQTIKVKWRGVPVFIRNRTKEDITIAKAVPLSELRDPETDSQRTKAGHEQWLVMIGVCTHLGCIPLAGAGDFGGADHGGWFCPCHGSQYDTAGRIRKGPAPKNLVVPNYSFLSDNRIKIG